MKTSINARRPIKTLLVVHDKDDQIVSWRQSEKLVKQIPQAESYYTNKLGHLRLLRDQALIQRVVEFIRIEG